jgi:alkylated DNA repair dioxygenase AlkB
MDLFNANTRTNLLPYGGTVEYYGQVLNKTEADHYMQVLLTSLDWKHDEAFIYGKHFVTPRKVGWYADTEFSYTYSGKTKIALPWTTELRELKALVEEVCGQQFNSCLANLYHTGTEGMAWHSDDEKALRKHGAIASLSLGAERTFSFKHKQTKERISMILGPGSLLVMRDETQSNWMHRLPPTAKVTRPRINLTFRTMDMAALR